MTSPSQQWEAVVGREDTCLKANARRYRVAARNAARAALAALRRHGLDASEAQDANVHITVYEPERGRMPAAVFSIAGTTGVPELQLRYARLLQDENVLRAAGGPLDHEALDGEVPRAARRRAEARIGSGGFKEVRTEAFWRREIGLYTGTALFLAAFGFPMTPGVFVAGGLLLLSFGAIRLGWRELRLARLRRVILRDPDMLPALRGGAAREMFLRGHASRGAVERQVLHGTVVVPDLSGENSLHLYVDEDSAVAVGGLSAAAPENPRDDDQLDAGVLSASHNVVTIVFRRPRVDAVSRPEEAVPPVDERLGLDEIGRNALVPAKVDADELGASQALADEEADIIEAEIIDADDDLAPPYDSKG